MSRVLRFTVCERALHWALAVPFLVTLTTGLGLGWGDRFGMQVNHFDLRRIHIVAGVAVVAAPLVVLLLAFVSGAHRRLSATLAALGGTLAEGYLVGFSAGQQVFAGAVAAGVVLSVASGIELWQWSWFPLAARRGAIVLHEALAYGSALAIMGHVYLAVVHRRTRWALPGIVTGWVDADRALGARASSGGRLVDGCDTAEPARVMR